ncbi:UNVERIFIED_CONTAM: hypothetical protein GTU68_030824 [Idotea baltica]|nr:hypothetical protein [Idotea baltica]
MSAIGKKKIQLALIQLAVGATKKDNLLRAAAKVKEAASKGAKLITLPECFNSPYGTDYFKDYAEVIPGESSNSLSNMAKENEVFLIGGSIPERDGNKLFNTCTVWDPKGNLVAKHRKVHLFDIDVPGGITFKESKVLSCGNDFTTFETPEGKIGVGICYDIRFAELAQVYAKMGCQLLIYPGAFNMTTGPVHWELLQRARAIDNQLYVATCSPARDTSASYIAWGHSSIVNPWGKVIGTTEDKEDIVYSEIDLSYLEQVRTMIPLRDQRRKDMYEITERK